MELFLTFLLAASVEPVIAQQDCSPAYPDVCIPPPPPDLDCGDISHRRFRVYLEGDSDAPSNLIDFDPHHFDGDSDGIGCER
ncbi:MAG: hypothetical protein AAF635_10075 [Cyanobacteria bacterium P01_C01_bin.69]